MPEDWEIYKLGDLTSVITKGTTPSTYGFNFESSGINYIKAESLNYDGTVDESAFVCISEEAHEKLKRSQLQVNDILFSMAGAYLGKVGMVKESHCPANTNQAVGIIRINNPLVTPKFVEYVLRNPITVSFVNSQSGQSAQPNINLAEIGNLTFSFPPLPEQIAIASILSALDEKIVLNLQQNKTLEEMAMALYKHWFVDFGPFQNGEFVESELGLIPSGWEVKRLDEIAIFKNGKGLNINLKNDNGLYDVFGSNGVIGKTDSIMFDKPVIAIGRVGANYGEVHYSVKNCWISDNAVTVQPLNQQYFWWLLQTLRLIDYSQFVAGSAQPLITQGAIKN